MIRASSPAAVSLIGQFLRDSGYDLAHLGHTMDLGDGLYANHENLEPLLARTAGDSTLSVLARLFFVTWPVHEDICRKALSPHFLEAAFECGLLIKDPQGIASSASITLFRSMLVATDSYRLRTVLPDMVVGPSASTQYPARFAIGGTNETTLDLGTGSGALSLDAASYSRTVIGTDVNPRALEFAAFNAALNGITNVEWRLGDAFQPVAGNLFTRILANPPFFLSPDKNFIYSDSPLDLDGFSASLARQAPAHLQEGGFFQMICEWVEIEGESWEQRLRDWTQASNCDVLVLLAPSCTPLSYAEKRSREARLMRSKGVDGYFSRQLEYLTSRNVKSVQSGFINMRKRSGGINWFSTVSTDPAGTTIGPDILARFHSLTFLSTATDAQMLASTFKLAPDAILDIRSTPATAIPGWQATAIHLVKEIGLTDSLKVDEAVSNCLPLFDGTRTLDQFAALVAQQANLELDQARKRALQLARRLLQSNFITTPHEAK